MSKDNIVPISPEASRHLIEARMAGAFDALYELGGWEACLRLITILSERLASRLRSDPSRGGPQ